MFGEEKRRRDVRFYEFQVIHQIKAGLEMLPPHAHTRSPLCTEGCILRSFSSSPYMGTPSHTQSHVWGGKEAARCPLLRVSGDTSNKSGPGDASPTRTHPKPSMYRGLYTEVLQLLPLHGYPKPHPKPCLGRKRGGATSAFTSFR